MTTPPAVASSKRCSAAGICGRSASPTRPAPRPPLKNAGHTGERFNVVLLDGQMPGVDGFALARRIRADRRLSRLPIVMLTSVGHAEQLSGRRRVDFDALLTKPVRHSDLLDTLATLFSVSVRHAPPRAVAKAPGSKAQRPLRVLVAEDNAVNRTLVTKLLQKRGHEVKAVSDGRAACDAAASRRPVRRPADGPADAGDERARSDRGDPSA